MCRLVLMLALLAPGWAAAQEPGARPADVASAEAILAAVYDAISGPAGAPRDWARFRSLFAADARLIPTTRVPEGWMPRTQTVEEWIQAADGWFRENAFYEEEIARVVETYGHVTHAFSTYVSRRAPGAEPFARGINSIQLFHDGARWWVVTIMWDHEANAGPVPERYLPRR
jgi:hypothetical protein